MFLLIYSIFLLGTPQHPALSSEALSANKVVQEKNYTSSAELANQALKGFKDKRPSSELVPLIEKSLDLNPYRISLYRLRSEVLSKESFSGFEVPLWLHVLKALNPITSFLIFSLFFILSIKFFARIYNAKINFKPIDKNLKFFAASSLASTLFFLSMFLWHYRSVYKPWVCITSEDATLHTAPSDSSVVSRSLPKGACLEVANTTKDWVSLNAERAKGWISKKNLTGVRGR